MEIQTRLSRHNRFISADMFVCLFFSWHISFCWICNAKFIFIQMVSSISNYSVYHKYTV